MTDLYEKYNKQTLTVPEAAEEIGVTAEDVESLIASGELAVKKIGEKFIIPIISLKKYLEEPSDQSYDTQPTSTSNELEVEELIACDPDGGSILFVKARNEFRYSLYVTENGKSRRVIKGGFHSREEAETALVKARDLINAVHIPVPSTGVIPETKETNVGKPHITVHDFLDKYLFTMFSAPTARTKDCYRNAAKLLLKQGNIGDMYVNELTRPILLKILNNMSGMSQSSLDKVRLVIRKLTEFAAEEGLIDTDIGRKIKKIKSTQKDLRSDDQRVYSKKQIDTILSCARKEDNPMLYTILILETLTGARPEEIRGLLKTDVDFKNSEIHIHQAAVMRPKLEGGALSQSTGRDSVVGPTKSPAGVRTLPIGEMGIKVIREWQEYLAKNESARNKSKFLFPSTTDAPMRDDVLNTAFNRMKKQYNLGKEYSLYKFRHTYATTLAEKGVPVKTAMRLMGDSTTNVILGVYTHVRNEEALRAGEEINQFYVDMLAKTDTSVPTE